MHDEGVLSMYSSDSQAMGRIGEVVIRAWQTADKMKKMKGKLKDEEGDNDNLRAKRYIAKTTINPAITQGVADYLGSLEVGKYADIVMYNNAFFAAKRKMVFKGGFIAWSIMGDPNASLPTPEPVFYRPMFGAMGRAVKKTSFTFMSKKSLDLWRSSKIRIRKNYIGC